MPANAITLAGPSISRGANPEARSENDLDHVPQTLQTGDEATRSPSPSLSQASMAMNVDSASQTQSDSSRRPSGSSTAAAGRNKPRTEKVQTTTASDSRHSQGDIHSTAGSAASAWQRGQEQEQVLAGLMDQQFGMEQCPAVIPSK